MVSKKDATEKQVVPREAYSRRGRKALLPDAPCGPRKWAGRAVLGFAGRPTETGARGAGSPAPLPRNELPSPSGRPGGQGHGKQQAAHSRSHSRLQCPARVRQPRGPRGKGQAAFPGACRLTEVRVLSGIRILGSADSSPLDPASEATPGGEPVAAAQ